MFSANDAIRACQQKFFWVSGKFILHFWGEQAFALEAPRVMIDITHLKQDNIELRSKGFSILLRLKAIQMNPSWVSLFSEMIPGRNLIRWLFVWKCPLQIMSSGNGIIIVDNPIKIPPPHRVIDGFPLQIGGY